MAADAPQQQEPQARRRAQRLGPKAGVSTHYKRRAASGKPSMPFPSIATVL